MIRHMDPTVIAALVTTPTALMASAVAYAAGRHQARGAHRGPVDAVRRQHQRDAYAAYLQALNAYAYAAELGQCTRQAMRDLAAAAGGSGDGTFPVGQVVDQAKRVRAKAETLLGPVRLTLDVVSLEGPKHVAELADQACKAANDLAIAAARATIDRPSWFQGPPVDPEALHSSLLERIAAFTTAARDYLNG